MITISQQQKNAQLVQTLIEKAWESEEFKAQLIGDPESVISEVLGKEIDFSSNEKIVIEDQTDSSSIYLNIPKKIDLDEIELTEEQMEMISGGGHIGAIMGGIIGALGGGAGAIVGAYVGHRIEEAIKDSMIN